MAAIPADIKLVKRAALPEDVARRKAEFDSSMVMIRHHVKFAITREDAEYFFRQLMAEASLLSRRHGLKVG